MQILFFIFLLLSALSFASPRESIPLADVSPGGVVEGVNIITGKYCEYVCDWKVRGAGDPLEVRRSYFRNENSQEISFLPDGPPFYGWYLNYDFQILGSKLDQSYLLLSEESGGVTYYKKSDKVYQFETSTFGKGATNCGSGIITAQNNLKNHFINRVGTSFAEVFLGDGTKRYYNEIKGASPRFGDLQIYYLSGSHLPSGNIIRHSPKRFCNGPEQVQIKNRSESKVFSAFSWSNVKNGAQLETSDGKKITYVATETLGRNGSCIRLLDKVIYPDGSAIKYHYQTRLFKGTTDFFLGADKPDGRGFRIDYTSNIGDNKVEKIRAPIGYDEKLLVSHRFVYEKNYTEVIDALGHKSRYFYDENERISKVEKWNLGKPYLIEKNVWGKGDNEGQLICKSVDDGAGTVYLARLFVYDKRGNVIEEKMFGNLKGRAKGVLQLSKEGIPLESSSCEVYVKTYSYSEDGFNLLLSESDEKATTFYSYQADTNLLTAKLIADERGNIRLREFRKYDADAILIERIEDDGTNYDQDKLEDVTCRKIVKTKPKQANPGIGLPEVVETWFYDVNLGKEVLFEKKVYAYTKHNEIAKEEIFNVEGVLIASKCFVYDAMGRVVLENDLLKNEIKFKYDANGNLVEKVTADLTSCFLYDFSNRLIKTSDKDCFGNEKTVRYRYDIVGNRVAETSTSGHETQFSYDDLGRLIQKKSPFGDVRSFEYDIAGNVLSVVDEVKNVTQNEYNIRGYITKTRCGDVEENFEYDLRGNLIKKVGRNGRTTLYRYDFLNRLIEQIELSASNEVLDSTSFAYTGYLLTSTWSLNSPIKKIVYDIAGREKEVRWGERKKVTEYDSHGNVSAIKEWFGLGENDYTAQRFRYDLLGRVIEERVEDSSGETFQRREFGYDRSSRRNRVTTFATGEPSYELTTYDGFGRVIKKEDALGNFETTVYQDFEDRKTEIDALGRKTVTKFDPLGHAVDVKKYAFDGSLVEEKRCSYNGIGNLVREEYEGKGKILSHAFKYGVHGELIEKIEEAETPGCRITCYNYEKGVLKSKETPLAMIYYEYDLFDRITGIAGKSKDSSLDEVDYHYRYNNKGELIVFGDHQHTTTRNYNDYGNLVEERTTGQKIAFEVDLQGRRTKCVLPDGSSIRYQYKGSFLSEIARSNTTGVHQYSHAYLRRNLEGRVEEAQLIGDCGLLRVDYDRLQRAKEIIARFWEEHTDYDRRGNLLTMKTKDPLGVSESAFTYDDRMQLKEESGLFSNRYLVDEMGSCIGVNAIQRKIGEQGMLVGEGISWDSEGNLRSYQGKKARYDVLCRMTEYDGTKFCYDALHRRVSRDGDQFIYDGENEIGVMRGGRIQELRVLGEGLGAEIGASIAVEIEGKVFAPLHDHRGNITALLDPMDKGKVVEFYRYSAYGVMERYDARGQKANGLGNSWCFASKRVEKSGWLFFGRRYYSPELMRFTTVDPLGFEDGPNLYAYLHNNPMTGVDLYGLKEEGRGPCGTRNILDGAWSLGRAIFKSTATAVEWIGKNMIIIPGVRDIVECVGRWGAGGKLFQQPEYRRFVNSVRNVPGRRVEGHDHRFINGQGNNPDGAMESTTAVGIRYGDVEETLYYNSSHGLLMDLLESFLGRLGWIAPVERMIAYDLSRCLSENPELKIHVNAHSQGGLHLYNAARLLSGGERSRIYVNTFGSAKLIPKGVFGGARNYVSRLDFVPMTDIVGYTKALLGMSDNVVFLSPSTLNPLKEHYFMGPTYQKALKEIGDNYAFKHGLWK